MPLNKLRIGEFADFLGLTTSMIRYYEENGIIESKRDEVSNYRYFDDTDSLNIIYSRLYRSIGFSISEIKEMLFNNNGKTSIDTFSQRINQIDSEIKKLKLMKKTAQVWKKRLVDEDVLKESFVLGARKACYYIYNANNVDDYLFHEANNAIKKYVAELPNSAYTVTFQIDDVKSGKEVVLNLGVCIDKEYVEEFDINDIEFSDVFEETECLHAVFNDKYIFNPSPTYESLKRVFEFAEKEEIELYGTVFCNYYQIKKTNYKYEKDFYLSFPFKRK